VIMTSEREGKLTAAPEVRIPDLNGLITGASAVVLAGRDLDALYYDTTDLELARSGITLRHRSGEPGPPWTLKLPGDLAGQIVTRHELTFEGSPTDVPAAARDLVSARVRSRPLVQIAQIATNRSPIEIRSATGERLAEIVDDRVAVHRGQPRPEEFREVEVEVFTHGQVADQLLVSALDRLVAAGCTASAPLPKLVRALGSRALEPPDLVVPSLKRRASLLELLRSALGHSVLQMLQHDPGVRLGGDPEDVHQFRVAIPRLRSDLRTFMPILDPASTREVRDELNWLGSVVGAVRDSDVLLTRLRVEADALPEEDDPGLALLRALLESEADAARTAMLSALRSPRYFSLLDTLINAAKEPPVRAERTALANQPAVHVGGKFARRPWRHLTEAVCALDDDAPDAALHNVRILAKRCRYAAETFAPVIGRAARLAAALADVQTVLGEHHDTVTAEAWLRNAAVSELKGALAAGELVSLQRLERARLRSEWPAIWEIASAKKLRSWI
jgi:CHAD domain-containing protein